MLPHSPGACWDFLEVVLRARQPCVGSQWSRTMNCPALWTVWPLLQWRRLGPHNWTCTVSVFNWNLRFSGHLRALVNWAMEQVSSAGHARAGWIYGENKKCGITLESPLSLTFHVSSISRFCGFFLQNRCQFWWLLSLPTRKHSHPSHQGQHGKSCSLLGLYNPVSMTLRVSASSSLEPRVPSLLHLTMALHPPSSFTSTPATASRLTSTLPSPP